MTYEVVLGLPKTAESSALSKELKRRGWSFVGPTTIYAFMQAVGIVNDHLHGCFVRPRRESERRSFRRPEARVPGATPIVRQDPGRSTEGVERAGPMDTVPTTGRRGTFREAR
jgi:DNA-3-methyladenine glycosylase I